MAKQSLSEHHHPREDHPRGELQNVFQPIPILSIAVGHDHHCGAVDSTG
ncbi:hypothetical protein C8K63_107145 [Pseudomonas sp. GV085]|nr:hypothetical protein C8K63_107145 [Pseudomonas sp. GV085]